MARAKELRRTSELSKARLASRSKSLGNTALEKERPKVRAGENSLEQGSQKRKQVQYFEESYGR